MTLWSANRRLLLLLFLATSSILVRAADDGLTQIHEAGRCAIRGNCGSENFFGPQLPCPDNDKAEVPADDVRTKLVAICGEEWSDTPVCCLEEQVNCFALF